MSDNILTNNSSTDSLSQPDSEGSQSLAEDHSAKELKGNASSSGISPAATNAEQTSNMDASDISTEGQVNGVSVSTRPQNKRGKQGQRTAMGEYIVTDGSKPLTSLAVATPGPADYCPNVAAIKPCVPQYSIGGKTKYVEEYCSPGPGKYRTDENILWKHRSIALKGKGIMYGGVLTKETKNCMLSDVRYGNLGTIAPKYKIGTKVAICSGPPNSLVQPVDTYGVHTPGPADYTPKSELWPHGMEQSFALEPRMKGPASKTPGPAEYIIERSKERGPHWSCGKRFYRNLGNPILGNSSSTPGPGAYQIATTIGRAVAKSMLGRPPEKDYEYSPGPNVYILPPANSDGVMHSMTYRPFEMKAEVSPGPAEYDTGNKNPKKGPKYTCGQHCLMSYPDILRHWKHAPTINPDVAPNSYGRSRDFAKNSKPRYSMGKTLPRKKDETPGPASYNVCTGKDSCSGIKPGISIGKKIEDNSVKHGPGPAAYNPKPSKTGPSYSISGWNKNRKGVKTSYPAANQYSVATHMTRTGKGGGTAVTMKSRPSPFLYSSCKRKLLI